MKFPTVGWSLIQYWNWKKTLNMLYLQYRSERKTEAIHTSENRPQCR